MESDHVRDIVRRRAELIDKYARHLSYTNDLQQRVSNFDINDPAYTNPHAIQKTLTDEVSSAYQKDRDLAGESAQIDLDALKY
jgi:hypothetical protein